MDAYDRCTNLGEEILPIVLPSVLEAENLLEHPRSSYESCIFRKIQISMRT